MEQKNKKDFHAYESYQPHLQPIDKPKGERIKKINNWLKRHQKAVLASLVVLILLIGGSFMYLFSGMQFDTIVANSSPKKKEKIYSPLTGAPVSEADSKRPVTAVMIENSPESRPQSGLKEGGVVFEAIAEGGITRFLVLYQEAQPEILGPVRSLRPYYIDWLAGFDPAVAHVGGSVSALKEIREGGYKDIDQFSHGDSYWRARDRKAPHNVYTSFELLNALNEKKDHTSSSFTGFKRKADKADKKAAPASATTITVPISSATYNSSYAYDAASNSYHRSQAGATHADREKGQISPKVVIVMEATMNMIMEDGYRENIQTIGSGKATIFQDGTAVAATWSKTSKKSQITFTDAAGKPIELNRGQTWITVVPTGKAPTWK